MASRRVRFPFPPGGFGCLWFGLLLVLLSVAFAGALYYDASRNLATTGNYVFMGVMIVFTLVTLGDQGVHTVELDTGVVRSRQGAFFPRSIRITELGLPLRLSVESVDVRSGDTERTELHATLHGPRGALVIAHLRSRDELAALAARLGLPAGAR
jgi:hypothetical protein